MVSDASIFTEILNDLGDYEEIYYATRRILIELAFEEVLKWFDVTTWLQETCENIKKRTRRTLNVQQTEKEDSADVIADSVANDVADGPADGAAAGVADVVADVVADGVANGVADGVANGVADGVPHGTEDSTADEVVDGSTTPRNLNNYNLLVNVNPFGAINLMTAKIAVMLQKLAIMICLLIFTTNTLKQWVCEPFVTIVKLAEIRIVPSYASYFYDRLFGEDTKVERPRRRAAYETQEIGIWDWDSETWVRPT